jgi:hypothetical protein
MMEILEAIGSSSFAYFLKSSVTIYTATLAFHSIGLAFMMGVSVAMALRVLGVAPKVPLLPFEDFCPLMTAGFWISAVTGVLLLVMDPVRLVPDPTLYIKMGAIVCVMALIRRLRKIIFDADGLLDSPEAGKRAKKLATQILVGCGVAIAAGKVMAYDWRVELQTAVAFSVTVGMALLVGFRLLGRARLPLGKA